MQKFALLIIFFIMFVFSALAQESADAPAEETEQDAAQEAAADEEADEPLVDDEYYQDVDDEDFRPSEDIPADQSIPFPTDI